MSRVVAVGAILFLALSAIRAHATTWHVAQDDTAEFRTIQSAVDVAASGDTILVGPGFYDDMHSLPPPWETDVAVVYVPLGELTIIGAGEDATTIGQRIEWNPNQGDLRGIDGGQDNGNVALTIESLGIEGMYQGLFTQGGCVLRARNCRFQRNVASLAIYSAQINSADTVMIRDCHFDTSEERRGQYHIWTSQLNYMKVSNCRFQLRDRGDTLHVLFYGGTFRMDDCYLVDGRDAVSVVCNDATIERTTFASQEHFGVVAQRGRVIINDCRFFGQAAALYESDYERAVEWAVTRIDVRDVWDSTLRYDSLGSGFIRESNLARGDELVVKYAHRQKSMPTMQLFDMTNNWWGTTNPDSIRAWIYDGKDDEGIGVVVDFEPFKNEQVAAQKTSLSTLKSLFR